MNKSLPLIIALIILSLISSYAHSKNFKFKEDNFSIKFDKSWKEQKKANKSLGHFFYSEKKQLAVIIRKLPDLIINNNKFPTNKKEYINFIRNNYLTSQIENLSKLIHNYFKIEAIHLNNYKGFLVNIKKISEKSTVSYGNTIIKERDNHYLLSIIKLNKMDISISDITETFKGFKILNSKKTNVNTQITLTSSNQTYHSNFYGYELPYFNDMIKATTRDLGVSNDESLFNSIFIGLKQSFVISVASICSNEITLSDRDFLKYFIKDFDGNKSFIKLMKDENGEYYATGTEYDEQLKAINFYFKATHFNDCNHLVMFYGDTEKNGLPLIQKITKQLKPYPINKNLIPINEIGELDHTHALFMNTLGNKSFSDDPVVSYQLLKHAHILSPENITYLNDYLLVANNQKHYSEALEFLDKSSEDIQNQSQFISWKAWLYAQTEKASEAIDIYNNLLQKKYTNDEDFFNFIDLLAKNKLWEKSIDVIAKFKDKVSKQKLLQTRLAIAYSHTDNREKARKILDDIISSDNFNDYNIYDILDIYITLENYTKAIDLLQKHIQLKGQDAISYYYLGDLQYLAGKPKASLKSMEKALEFSPNNKDIINYIAGIKSTIGMGDITITKTKITAVPLPKTIKKDIKNIKLTNLDKPIKNYYHVTAYDFKKNHLMRKTYYRKVKVINLKSSKDIKTIQIQFNKEYEHPYINRFEVKNLDTNIVTQLDLDTVYISSVNDGINADNDVFMNIPVPSISNNTEIEYVISIESNSPVDQFNFKTEYFVSAKHYEYIAISVQGDIDLISSEHSKNIKEEKFDQLQIWKSSNIEQYKKESYIGDIHKQFEWLELASTEKNWKILGDNYIQRIEKKLHSDISKGLLLSIFPDSRDKLTTIKEIAKYVQSSINYQALEFGNRAQIPNNSNQTLTNKYGDCKDHAVLLYDLLHEKGIKANLALVNTDKYINKNLVSLDQFNHVIVYIPDVNGGIFIDATDKYTALNLQIPPRSIQGSEALVLKRGKSQFISIPAIDVNQNTINIERTISENDNKYIFNETAVITGYLASDLRAYLQPLNKDHIHTNILQWVNAYYPDIGLVAFDYYNLDNLDKPVILEFTLQQNKHNSDFKVPVYLERSFSTFDADNNRLYPFKFDESFSINSVTKNNGNHLIINLINKHQNSEFINWSLKNEHDKQHFQLTLKSGIYPANRYEYYIDTIKTALFNEEKSFVEK